MVAVVEVKRCPKCCETKPRATGFSHHGAKTDGYCKLCRNAMNRARRNSPHVPIDRSPLTAERLRTILHYDPLTGLFTWIENTRYRRVGEIAGYINSKGYRTIIYAFKTYGAHRLAWLYVKGEWPASELDHENGERADNRWDNLRLADSVRNGANRKRGINNRSGYKGVSWNSAERRWKSGIKVKGKSIHLGYFDDPSEAHAAYVAAAQEHFGEFARAA